LVFTKQYTIMATTSVTSSSRTDSASEKLRREILDGLAAPGDLLAESAVARRLGVSRVPVREALFDLERDGLVEFSETGRAYVKRLTPADFEELFVVRLALEPLASRLATPKLRTATDALERNIAATQRAKTVQQVTRLDLDFHEIILTASGNTRLLKLWSSMRAELELWLGRLHRRHQFQTSETQRETIAAHTAIVQGFHTQSPAECERLMRQHILGWREWLPVLAENE
jgi:DNA-binding GntR family transcriptional regulator